MGFPTGVIGTPVRTALSHLQASVDIGLAAITIALFVAVFVLLRREARQLVGARRGHLA
jgi:hypothetical protein